MYNIKISTVCGSRISIQCKDRMVLWFNDNEVHIAPILMPKEQYLIVSEEKNPRETEHYTLSLFIYPINLIKQFIIS